MRYCHALAWGSAEAREGVVEQRRRSSRRRSAKRIGSDITQAPESSDPRPAGESSEESASSRSRGARSRRARRATGPLRSGRVELSGEEIAGRRARRREGRTKTIVLRVLAVMALLFVAAGAYAAVFIAQVNRDLTTEDTGTIAALTKPVFKKKSKAGIFESPDPFNILLLGVDGQGKEGDTRSDTIIVARVVPKDKRVWMLSIPRDTRADIPGYGHMKINKAYQLGGPSLAIKTVREFLGIPVNHYMQVNVNGFKRIVEVLGGVWIDVDVEIDDKKAAGANVGKAGSHIDKGYQLLNPDQALVYVRSRDFPDADFARMRHQQTFFKALAKQSTSITNIWKLPKVVREVAKFTKSTLGVSELFNIARALYGMNDKGIDTATVTGEWRSPFIWTDEELKQDLVERMMAGKPLEDTAATVVPADVIVEVRNGYTAEGVAREAAAALTLAGFELGEVANAKRNNYEHTLVIYDSPGKAPAEAVVAALGQGQVAQNMGDYEFDGDVLVIVGADWSPVSTGKTPTVR